ncbi:MAG: nucleotide exchange factor GrpE [Bacteroidota bacterium]
MSKKDILDKDTEKDAEDNQSNDKKAGTKKEKKPRRGSAAAKVNRLESEVTELKSEIEELKGKYLRQAADFDNFRKRTAKERIDLIKTAAQDTLSNLLPVIDDFDRAVKAGDSDDSTEKVSDGVKLVYNRLKNTLEQIGLKEMETNGEIFDPELHDAITEIPAPSDDLKGKIVDTIEKGYYLGDKIIRYARVVVGK